MLIIVWPFRAFEFQQSTQGFQVLCGWAVEVLRDLGLLNSLRGILARNQQVVSELAEGTSVANTTIVDPFVCLLFSPSSGPLILVRWKYRYIGSLTVLVYYIIVYHRLLALFLRTSLQEQYS